ncbi:hypothetical protein GCM10011575_13430 [Microlunatus endophyticus]|uniref:DUF427 domain-containing protein n=1 Tax=Microlunatus endophyticus TaxID=1716077 RepID=A0A917W2S6_9ACTN|nr:DUF427 domain-containing protein [Microlunatus endophyticus]GGL56299.1 hypothetical protein GCM10011575_13430 [Microlunatus endophyticus]
MSQKPIKVPGPDHPITVTPSPDHVTAIVAGRTIAESTSTLALAEASYPVVHYFPRADVDMTALERTDHKTYCPYKGDASYFSIRTADGLLENAVWTYEQPHDALAEIDEYVAFYTDRVDVVSTPVD